MTTINGNLELDRDTTYGESLTVNGSIYGKGGNRYNLTVNGDINAASINTSNINCWDIDCWNIDCLDINCRDIDCGNINCWDINCGNIDACFILCETLKQKEGSTLTASSLIENRSVYEQHEIKR